MGRYPEVEDSPGVLLLSTTQMESTLCFLNGILVDSVSKPKVHKMVLGTRTGIYPDVYPPEFVKEILLFVDEKSIKFVLVSLIEYSLGRALALMQEIKRHTSVVIVVGGPYAIEHPEKCIDHGCVDVVNYAHGLYVGEIINFYPDLSNVPNIYYKNESSIKRTLPKNIGYCMDMLPLPDWSQKDTYIIFNPVWHNLKGGDAPRLVLVRDSGGALPVEHHQVPHRHTGVLILSKGCPINTCSFCSISRMYDKNVDLLSSETGVSGNHLSKVSWYSADKAIEVVERFLECHPNTEYLLFNDNDFASIPGRVFEQFSEEYIKRVHLPFYCQSSPHLTYARGRQFIARLVEMGLDTYCMGIETARQANTLIYSRRGPARIVSESVQLLNEFVRRDGIHVAYDFINGNPLETREQLLETIDLIRSIPLPWNMALHNLTLDDDIPLSHHIQNMVPEYRESRGKITTGGSDYHSANYSNFKLLRESYLNIVLEWCGGLHDDSNTGRLKRSLEQFLDQDGIRQIVEQSDKFRALSEKALDSGLDTLSFLVSERVYSLLSGESELIEQAFELMRPIQYGYHRANRYEYDWGFALRQLSG